MVAIRMRLQPHEVPAPTAPIAAERHVESDWRQRLPLLGTEDVVLRQLRHSDAAALLMLLTTEEVARFITPPPTTLSGFEQFVEWALDRQRQAKVAVFAVVPRGGDTPVGLFQVRSLEPGFATAECGFALGSPYWGTGLFLPCAELLQRFAFDGLGVQRLEARSMVENARGNGALRKMGAMPEGILRQSFEKEGLRHDQYLWSILAEEWRQGGAAKGVNSGRLTTPTAPQQDRVQEGLWAPTRSPILVRVH
jgi:RimJ/RimL family protein N-acetyltransferase